MLWMLVASVDAFRFLAGMWILVWVAEAYGRIQKEGASHSDDSLSPGL